MKEMTTERKQFEELLNRMPCGAGLFDLTTGQNLILNDAYYAMTGYTPAEYARMREKIAPDCALSSESLREKIRKELDGTGKFRDLEFDIFHRDGTRRWFKMSTSCLTLDGTQYALSMISDCTAQKKADDAEREQKLMMSSLLNELPGGVAIFRMGEQLECQYFSDGFAAISGHSRAEVEEMLRNSALLTKIVPPEYYADFLAHLRAENPIGVPLSFTYRFLRKNGELGWLHVSAIKIREEDGCPVYYCIYTTPTDETALYRSIVEDSAIGVFIADRATRTNLYANEALCRLCRFEAGHIAGMPLADILTKYDREALLSDEEVASLRLDRYSEFHVERRGVYLAIKAKAVLWNGVDSYILYIADETAEHKNQLCLEQTLVKEQTLIEAIPGGAAIYRAKKNGRAVMEYASDGVCKMLGYTRGELLGAADAGQFVCPEDLPLASQAVQEAMNAGRPISVTYRCVKKDGETILNHLDAKLMVTGDLGAEDVAVLYAVHSRVSEESQLAMQEQQYYRMMLDMTGTAYFEWDEKSGFYASEKYAAYAVSDGGMETLMGGGEECDYIHPDDMPTVRFYLRNAERHSASDAVTIRMKMHDGSYQWTEVTSYARRSKSGRMEKIIGVLRNVDREWVERSKKLQAALDAAEKANRAKTAFLSRVSHDMRTPLNGILGLTEFLKESVKDEQAAHDISQLEISGQYLLNLINDTLDVSRIENGKLELHPVVCEAGVTFENLIKLAKPSVEAKHLKLVVQMDALQNAALYIDVGRVEQIIMNIVGNAVKFTPEGGTITCTLEHLAQTPDCLTDRIAIRDTGIGMSKDFLPVIFDAFSQADSTRTNARQGTGLGMAITKQLVDLMGGSITVESEPGKGSCFTLVLPLRRATTEQIALHRASLAKETDTRILKGKRVLLCEDHPLNREIAMRMLKNKEMLVETAENGKCGVEAFEASPPHYYDLVLMDVRMPLMDGLDATRAIRRLAREDAHTVPIIAMTGNSFDEDIAQSLDAGMNAHLSKPIDPVKLFETLREELSHTRFFRRKKVLVVDDIELNRTVIAAALAPDYDIVEAASGIEALAVLEKDKEIDAVITDIMMREMDGCELIRRMRENSAFDRIAIIANTQYEEMTRQDELIAMGVDGFLFKPNTPAETAAKLHAVLTPYRKAKRGAAHTQP